ncbi:MAG: hypothetical protein E2P05_00565 [Acidobacteria bacterium]|nr:MAG: hypothetical protein E2P05_00565 [Acidobacteriota bacterium]
MTKQAEMLKCMNQEERQAWATQRLRAFFRSLRHEGYTLKEIGDAALVCGGGALMAAKGKEDAASYLTGLAFRILDGIDPLPAIDEPSRPELLL